ncbi:hypothetical protein [Helicobacter sp. T3_23-1056]
MTAVESKNTQPLTPSAREGDKKKILTMTIRVWIAARCIAALAMTAEGWIAMQGKANPLFYSPQRGLMVKSVAMEMDFVYYGTWILGNLDILALSKQKYHKD